VPAFDRAGDASWYPELGDPWQPSKLYYTVWARARIEEMHLKMLELGMESPFTQEWFDRPSHDDRITTRIEVGDYYSVRQGALLAHATQVDPTSKFWFGLPEDVAATIHPYDDYVLAQSRVADTIPETDLFAGLR
jgi:mycothiol S-conjugate amidase